MTKEEKTAAIGELKIRAYDLLVIVEQGQAQLREANQQIVTLMQEPTADASNE